MYKCHFFFLVTKIGYVWNFFHLQEKSEQLEHKLEMRRKQFHVLISSIHSLQGMLDECDEEVMDVSLENYENMDVQMSAAKDIS